MSTELFNPDCASCPRMDLPKKALAKAEDMREVADTLTARADAADNMIEYQTEDGRLVTERERLIDQIKGINDGAEALSLIARNAITECQSDCPGYDQALVVCQGNTQNEFLRMLEADYGEGGLE